MFGCQSGKDRTRKFISFPVVFCEMSYVAIAILSICPSWYTVHNTYLHLKMMMRSMGYGPIYLGANFWESVCRGRTQEARPSLYSRAWVQCRSARRWFRVDVRTRAARASCHTCQVRRRCAKHWVWWIKWSAIKTSPLLVQELFAVWFAMHIVFHYSTLIVIWYHANTLKSKINRNLCWRPCFLLGYLAWSFVLYHILKIGLNSP